MTITACDDGTATVTDGEEHPIILWLDSRVGDLLHRIRETEFWRTVVDSATEPAFVRDIMKEVYLEIAGYQPHVIEAAIAAIAQMPRSIDPRIVRSMLVHQSDEFDHGEMALRDYVGLGGSEAVARHLRMSPASYSVAGVWWMISHLRDPFAYLGALYLFEGLTPTVTAAVKGGLRNKGFSDQALEYIEFHSTEDVKHANLVRHLIAETARRFPDSVESIKYGYECFGFVYPIPVWQAAYERAKGRRSP